MKINTSSSREFGEKASSVIIECAEARIAKSGKFNFAICGGRMPIPIFNSLKDKYKNTKIYFLGAIFNKEELDTFRFFAKYYLHGHSVGGTNPALIEAMAASAFVIIHDNPFNKSVVSSNNYSFANKEQLIELLENEKKY